MRELIIDSFCGGGGASNGIYEALGHSPDIAINHDEDAISMHTVNHPATKHYREDVWKVDPLEATGGRPVGLAWWSPDCTHFSIAPGGVPVEKKYSRASMGNHALGCYGSPKSQLLRERERVPDVGPAASEWKT